MAWYREQARYGRLLSVEEDENGLAELDCVGYSHALLVVVVVAVQQAEAAAAANHQSTADARDLMLLFCCRPLHRTRRCPMAQLQR